MNRDASQEPDNAPQLETVGCPFCGAPGQNEYAFPPYIVKACPACDLLFLGCRIAKGAVRELYAAPDYFSAAYGDHGYDAQKYTLALTYRQLIRNVGRVAAMSGSLLEIGCGPGVFLQEAHDIFAERRAIEFSDRARREAAKHCTEVYGQALEELDFSERFNWIVALQVIEHIYEPRPFVTAAYRALVRGGRILLTTPDAGSFWRRIWGRRWPSFKVPEHVVLYKRASLQRLLTDAGFVDISFVDHPHAFPLMTVLEKLGVRADLGRLGQIPLWLPRTCLAVIGKTADAVR